MILTATMAVSSTLFFRSIENATPGTPQRWIAGLLGGICFALSFAGFIAIMMAIAHWRRLARPLLKVLLPQTENHLVTNSEHALLVHMIVFLKIKGITTHYLWVIYKCTPLADYTKLTRIPQRKGCANT
jgi:hypothetical protein